MNETKDFNGNPIKVGDEVAYMRVRYRDLCRGVITKINDKKVTIKSNDSDHLTQQFHNQVIKLLKRDINNE